jgi:CheY-like chemotaxis protein
MARGRFLVVDDMEPCRRMIVRWLKRAGEIDVLQAGSRLEALQVLGQHDAWTGWVVDVDLADGDGGIRFLKEARLRFPHVRALVITAHDDPVFPVQAYWLTMVAGGSLARSGEAGVD